MKLLLPAYWLLTSTTMQQTQGFINLHPIPAASSLSARTTAAGASWYCAKKTSLSLSLLSLPLLSQHEQKDLLSSSSARSSASSSYQTSSYAAASSSSSVPSPEVSTSTTSRSSSRRSFISFLAAAGFISVTELLSPEHSPAFCGEPFPSWAYEVEFEEGVIPFSHGDFKGDLYIRQIGGEQKEKKANVRPIIVFSTAGLTHEYLSTIEAAVHENRRVISFDPIGCGTSSTLPTDEEGGGADNKALRQMLLSPACLQAQADTVLQHLEIKDHHLFGHGTGAAMALQRVQASSSSSSSSSPRAVSLTLASPILSNGRAVSSSQPPGYPSPDYVLQALEQYSSKKKAIPICLTEASQKQQLVDARFSAAARAADADSGSSVKIPTLVILGANDNLLNHDDVDALIKSLPTSTTTVTTLANCGHMAHLDDRETFMKLLQDFYGTVDAA